MKYSYDFYSHEAIIRDYLVYDAALLAYGELLMKDTTATEPGRFVTAYNATAANQAIDAIGILNEKTYETDVPDTATGSGGQYGKVIINPFAIYMAEHSLAAADDVAITSTATTTVTIPTLQDNIDFCWVYFPTATAGVKGSLRLLTASAAGSATMDSALTVAGTGADTAVIISAPVAYSMPMEATAVKMSSGNCQSQFNSATNLRILETFIDRDNGLESMKPGVHKGINNLDLVKGGNGPKFYYKIMLKDHVFGLQE
jgi:hypothetical protein